MADNWYVILDLPFDPPEEDEGVIAAKIDEKSKFWSTHFNDFKMGPQYRAWHQNIPQIKKDMIGPANIRSKLAAEACVAVYEPVDRLLKTIGRKGNITADEAEKMSKKLKLSVDVVKKRAAKLGIRFETGPAPDYQAVYDKYYKTKPQNAAAFDGMKQMLASFGVSDLYEFLYAGTTVKNARNQPCANLLQRAEERKKNEFYKNDSVSGTGSKLCGQCEMAFANDSAKAVYDNYLEYVRRKTILDDAKSVAEISGELEAEQGEAVVGQLTQIFRDRKLAEEVLTAFCKVEKIIWNTGGSQKSAARIKVCRCGCMNDVADGRRVCSACGLELTVKCPECGTENDAGVKVCKCGFRLDALDKAIALCELAECAMEALDFKVAQAHLTDAERCWPGSTKAAALRKQLAEYEKRVGAEVEKMRVAIRAKRYMEAQQQYTDIKKLFAGYSDPGMEESIAQAIANARSLYAQAQGAKTEKDVLELCARAYDACADLPGVKELMSKYPPAPAAGFSVTANPGVRGNIVSWLTDPEDRSIRYVVVRSTVGWVRNIADGEEIFRGSASTFCDKQIEPGIAYYYNVFAERAGIVSRGAVGEFKEVVNLFDVAHLSAAAGDGSLNLTWQTLPPNATAEVYQISAGGGEKHIASSQSDSWLLSGLTNDSQYRFRVSLSYLVNGKKLETKGAYVAGVPTCPPMPIDTLRVTPGQDDLFEATWFDPGQGEVRLFCSPRKPEYDLGEIVSIAALEREMKPLQQQPLLNSSAQKLKSGEKGVSFRYSGTELLYITAVVVKAGSAVFGSLARASRGERVAVTGIRPVNGKINIYLDAPREATGFVVLYRFDQFPSGLDDVKTVRKYVPLKDYTLNSAIVLDTLEEKKYYFSVFAEFRRDGEKDYSAGADWLFDHSAKLNITYSIAVNKKLFGDSTLTLEFEADSDSFLLPDIDIMSAVGNAPVFKSSARLFHAIPSQQVEGSLQVKLPMPKGLARDTYIKAFFRDESAQSGNQLRLKLKSNYKIT